MERPSALDYVCIGEAEKKRLTVRGSPDDYFNWFPASLIKSVWNVLIYQFQDTQTPAYCLALQLPFSKVSESMGNHDSKIVDAGSVD
jgi:hypothetical protein